MTTSSPAGIASLLQQGLAAHQQGRLQEARSFYGQVLGMEPGNFDALHLMGVLARQSGEPEAAVELIGAAIAIGPDRAIAHCNLGAALQDLQRHEAALASFERALALQPDYAIALGNRGNALRQLGQPEPALASYARALQLAPASADVLHNQGIALQMLDRHQDALASFDKALALKPGHADAWSARGVSLQQSGRFADAEESYGRALQLKPAFAEGLCNRGTLMQRLGRHEEALADYGLALQARPQYALAHQYRANTLRALGRHEEAIAAYHQALACGADAQHQPYLHYMLATLGAEPAPAAPPAQYVRELFDQYAGHFDEHLVGKLQYRTPQLLVDALRPALPPGQLDTLDLGCGTGLCAPLLAPFSTSLTGVDLSQNMLAEARRRGLYTGLACDDITSYLRHCTQQYDLVAAADVFVYVGELDPVFEGVRAILRPGGVFAFSVEAEADAGLTLRPSGRYAHGEAYLRMLAGRHGFEVRELSRHAVRQDRGADVEGYLVVLRG
jgi:predicted TPR repeat methyltransferase